MCSIIPPEIRLGLWGDWVFGDSDDEDDHMRQKDNINKHSQVSILLDELIAENSNMIDERDEEEEKSDARLL